jgi:hypothetical protein
LVYFSLFRAAYLGRLATREKRRRSKLTPPQPFQADAVATVPRRRRRQGSKPSHRKSMADAAHFAVSLGFTDLFVVLDWLQSLVSVDWFLDLMYIKASSH